MPKETKVITRRKKFLEVEIPSVETKIEIMGDAVSEINGKTIKLDLTRQLKGKSLECDFKIFLENNKPIAKPFKIKLMPYFIRRMIRKRISYIEDSFQTPSQESLLSVKAFLITRKRVSRAVRKTLRNKTKNWLEDYISQKKDDELFREILSSKIQKPLSITLKKTYPLSLCEIRMLEIKRPLKKEEVPTIKEIKKEILVEPELQNETAQIEDAQEEIKKAQKKALEKEKEIQEETKSGEISEEKTKKTRKKKTIEKTQENNEQ